MQKKRPPLAPPPISSSRIYIRLTPRDTRMFRYLLEGYDSLAYTSIVERKTSVLKINFSPNQKRDVEACLEEIRTIVPFDYLDSPTLA